MCGVLALYLAIVLTQASKKLLWGDELFTFYIARRGVPGIWAALQAGADPNPPLMHVAVLLTTRWFGVSALTVRLPSVLFVALALVAMWVMLRRWVTPMYAAAGLLAFMATRGFDYAYDARSYGPMMGLAMASLALWMEARDGLGWRRWLALAAMTLALAGGVSANYYGVLAFFPIAAGEWVRARERGRLRIGVWLGLAAASLPLLVYLPLIRHNIGEFAPHAWNRPRLSMMAFSYFELVEGVFWPVAVLALVAWLRGSRAERTVPACDATALCVLLAYPVLGFAIAVGGAGMISPRCAAPVCCGFGLAAAVLGQRVFGRASRAGLAMAGLLLVWVLVREGICREILRQQTRAFLVLRDQVKAAAADTTGAPILVADSSFVLPLYFYSDRAVQNAIVFPIDFAAIHRLEADDSGEENLWGGRDGVFPFTILPFAEGPETSPLLLIGRPDGWLAQALQHEGFELHILDASPNASSAWEGVGGVFTPLAHPESRLIEGIASRRDGVGQH